MNFLTKIFLYIKTKFLTLKKKILTYLLKISKKYIPDTSALFSNKEMKMLDSISDFDKAILNFCGDFGSIPKKEDFIKILKDPQYSEDLNYIYEGLNKTTYVDKIINKEEFIISLSDIIFDDKHHGVHGFEHVMCGTNTDKGVTGLHYYYRFMDLQKRDEHVVSYDSCVQKYTPTTNAVKNYKIGFFDEKAIEWKTKCDTSAVTHMNARDIIILLGSIKKIKINKKQIQRDDVFVCTHKIKINEEDIFVKFVFHVNSEDLITFYPIEKDHCKDKKENCYCEFLD
jgi:hypothetical protein